MNEDILGIVAPTEGKGKGGVRWGGTIKRFALVFTSDRLIVTKLAGLLTILGGSLGDMGSLLASRLTKKTSELAGMPLEEILKADKDNYAIQYSDIVKVDMKKRGLIGSPGIIISTATEKHVFVILREEGFRSCVDLVNATLSDKLSPG
jgi:hypothetical protein